MKKQRRPFSLGVVLLALVAVPGLCAFAAERQGVGVSAQMFERTFESHKRYADPFNDVDVDVIFSRGGRVWRVPTFWHGGSKWTVRFRPPVPGDYTYRLQSTDPGNPDLNGHGGRVTIPAYTGTNELLRHGMLQISPDRRHFAYADGTPFYWLGDTWWAGLSTRLSWPGFKKLTADRKAKGFTVVQIVAGLVPGEEKVPVDPGSGNEGGAVWDPDFKRINPRFFDYADRRVQLLVDSGIAPAIVGAWGPTLGEMGPEKLKKHWRYIIARYGAYPVFWILGGEVYDPPEEVARKLPGTFFVKLMPGWTDIGRYVRATDPMHHPLTVHELPPPYDVPLQDESVTDFDLLQPSHFSWPSIATEVAELDLRYARTGVTKPLVVGEIGYEGLGGIHLADFQRVAFWLGMLNGAAGFTYGANGTWESYSADKLLHRKQWSFVTWDEGMNFPGSTQVGLGAKLLRQYSWERFSPHPEWVSPHGTTLLEPNSSTYGEDVDLLGPLMAALFSSRQPSESDVPGGEWKHRHGNFRLPYAAGIPGEVRFIYLPYFGLIPPDPPTIFGLEPGVRYHAYYWEPSLGIKFDLGAVERPRPGALIVHDAFGDGERPAWIQYGNKPAVVGGRLSARGRMLAVVKDVTEKNVVGSVSALSRDDAGLVMRYHDPDNYVGAVYSAKESAIYLLDRRGGVDGPHLGSVSVSGLGSEIELSAEVRDGYAAVSVTDGRHTFASPIVALVNANAGQAGLLHTEDAEQSFRNFELRMSPTLPTDAHLERKLYDAWGRYRGEMRGGPGEMGGEGWSAWGRQKHILLDAYRPESTPGSGDWLLVMEALKPAER